MSLNNQLSLSRRCFPTFNTTQNQPNINVNLTLALDVFPTLNVFFIGHRRLKKVQMFSHLISPCVFTLIITRPNPFLWLQGKPRPIVTWFKDGAVLEDNTVGTRTSDKDTILFIRSAERGHSGKYTLSVQIENMSDSADIHIQVVGQSHHGTDTSPDLYCMFPH